MSVFKRVLMLCLLLTGALVSYQAGFQSGVFVLLVLGAILELGFWLGLSKWGRKKSGA